MISSAIYAALPRNGGTPCCRLPVLRHRAQRGGITKHLRQRHVGADDLAAEALFHPCTIPRREEIAHNIPGVLFRRVSTSTCITGSRDHQGPLCARALPEAEDRRHGNAISEESTSWYDPKGQGRSRQPPDNPPARRCPSLRATRFLHGRDVLAAPHRLWWRPRRRNRRPGSSGSRSAQRTRTALPPDWRKLPSTSVTFLRRVSW